MMVLNLMMSSEFNNNTPVIPFVHSGNHIVRLGHHLKNSRSNTRTLLAVGPFTDNDHCLVYTSPPTVDEVHTSILKCFLNMQAMQVTSRKGTA